MAAMICGNGQPECRNSPAPGYNPLGLCVACLTRYRGISGSPVAAGEGIAGPRREYVPMSCKACNGGRCVLAKVTTKPTEVTIVAPRAGCPHLRQEPPPAVVQTPAKGKRKRPAPPSLPFGG